MRTKVTSWHLILISLLLALGFESLPLPQALRLFWPDWVLLVLIYWHLTHPSRVGVGVAWLTGLFVDAAQFSLLGEHALKYVLVVLLVGHFRHRMVRFTLLQQALLIFIMLLASVLIEAITATVLGRNVVFFSLLAMPLVGALLWPAFQYFMHRLFQARQTGLACGKVVFLSVKQPRSGVACREPGSD